jgi:hypothetical protein
MDSRQSAGMSGFQVTSEHPTLNPGLPGHVPEREFQTVKTSVSRH